MRVALGLDLGTTSLSAVAVALDGTVLATVNRPHTAALTGLTAGAAEQEPRQLWSEALGVLRDLVEQLAESPHCLGLTGQMHGMLLVDAQRRPLTNLITWQDRRANLPVPGTARTWLQEYLSRCRESDLAETGCRLSAGYMGTTLFLLAQQNLIPPSAHRASFLADWMAAELTAGEILTDRSNAAASGVYDLRSDRWSEPLISAGELPRQLLPEVRANGVPLGGVTSAVAEQTGLPAGLPVCNPLGDNQAAVLGSVPVGDPAIQINVGTGGQINWPVPEFVRVEGMDTRPLPPGRLMLVGAGLAGGDAYSWVNRTVDSWLRAFAVEVPREEIYARLNAAVAAILPDCDGLSCEPLFRGTRRRPDARGTFAGVRFENFTLGHVGRAVLAEGEEDLHRATARPPTTSRQRTKSPTAPTTSRRSVDTAEFGVIPALCFLADNDELRGLRGIAVRRTDEQRWGEIGSALQIRLQLGPVMFVEFAKRPAHWPRTSEDYARERAVCSSSRLSDRSRTAGTPSGRQYPVPEAVAPRHSDPNGQTRAAGQLSAPATHGDMRCHLPGTVAEQPNANYPVRVPHLQRCRLVPGQRAKPRRIEPSRRAPVVQNTGKRQRVV